MKKSIGVFINNRGYEGEEMIFSPFVMMLQIRPENFCSFIFLSFIAFLKKKRESTINPPATMIGLVSVGSLFPAMAFLSLALSGL